MHTAMRSRHFDLQQVADGVFAAIATQDGWAICNSGIIDLGGQTVVFDTFLTPSAALDLRRAAEELTGRTPDIVVNSHDHNDHIWGNQVFDQTTRIIASAATCQQMTSGGPADLAWYRVNATAKLESLRGEAQHAANDAQRTDIGMWVSYYEGLLHDLPNLTLRLPDVMFDERRTLRGSKRTVELIAYAGGHAISDTVLYLPGEGVFAGDLLFVGFHPYLADGDPERLLQALQKLAALDAGFVVPGHGPVGSRADVRAMNLYVRRCMERAEQLVASGNMDEVGTAKLTMPPAYAGWRQPQMYYTNMAVLCQRLQK